MPRSSSFKRARKLKAVSASRLVKSSGSKNSFGSFPPPRPCDDYRSQAPLIPTSRFRLGSPIGSPQSRLIASKNRGCRFVHDDTLWPRYLGWIEFAASRCKDSSSSLPRIHGSIVKPLSLHCDAVLPRYLGVHEPASDPVAVSSRRLILDAHRRPQRFLIMLPPFLAVMIKGRFRRVTKQLGQNLD